MSIAGNHLQSHLLIAIVRGGWFATRSVTSGLILFSLTALCFTCSTSAFAEGKHLGVASCASSTCHGSNVAFADSAVMRNEFRIWNENDPHARAFKTLLSAESKRMAKNLGIEAAESSVQCLGCHADYVSEDRRGEEFKLSDGVGCEACHGGGESYLDIHTDGDHQANLENGLYPSEDPHARAELCVACHVGNDQNQKITHQIMGAGHPRLTFELNTFSSIQPAHYTVDSDYVERKGDITELQVWAIGQVVAAQQHLKNIQKFPRDGLFPELVHMDCLSCHQEMSKVTWTKNPLTKLPAGALRYNDAYLMTSYQIVKAVLPEKAPALLESVQSFLNADQARALKLLDPLAEQLSGIVAELKQRPIASEQGLTLLAALVDVGLASSHRDYAAAEQSAMAINSVLKVLDAENKISDNRQDVIRGMDDMFKSLQTPSTYRPAEFLQGLRKVRKLL